jgi:hypothetical protein
MRLLPETWADKPAPGFVAVASPSGGFKRPRAAKRHKIGSRPTRGLRGEGLERRASEPELSLRVRLV